MQTDEIVLDGAWKILYMFLLLFKCSFTIFLSLQRKRVRNKIDSFGSLFYINN